MPSAPTPKLDAAVEVGKKVGKGGRPSTSRRAVGGAAAGAATGATLGSVVPGIGTGIGAGVGAGVGAVAGGYSGHKEKQARRAAGRSAATNSARQILVAEFVLCMIVLAFSPLTAEAGKTSPKDWMKRGTAMCGLFLVLALVGTGGPGMARISASFGGLVTLALVVDQRSLFVLIAQKFGTTGTGDVPQLGPTEQDTSPPPPLANTPGVRPRIIR